MTDVADYQAIKSACLYYLARREHSQQELLTKVAEKGFVRSMIQEVVSELEERGLQSNARFAESYARHRVQRGFGPLHIGAALQQRGAGGYDFDMAVEDIVGSWALLLEQVYTKKYTDKLASLDSKERLKRSRFLQQRGFSGEMINQFFRQL